ncbi:hypothetical protein [Faecalispora sporosphaeroides]|uniref:hypothetical protein n=1 Tax=Faecalispora sporosphaeroides TaxID=1549 RepID=UPI000364A0C1|nr:hypothetical protein [Faecalispora sporosphaeroides]
MFQANDQEMNRYFSSLPHFIQESIQQSSVEIHSIEELKAIAENLQSQERQNNS